MDLNETLPQIPTHIDQVGINESKFDLSDRELSDIEQEVCKNASEAYGETVSVAWMTADHPFANYARTRETRIWPEASDVDPEYDMNQVYLAVVDTREGVNKIVHAASVMRPRPRPEDGEVPLITGIYTVDSLIERGNFTAAEFYDYYDQNDVDVDHSIAVETNFKLVEDFEPFMDLGSADLTYLTLFNMLIDNESPIGKTVVFATINNKQIKSLERVGVDVHLLMGRDDFRTEEAELGVYSMPVAIQVNQKTFDIFKSMNLALPELVY